MTCSALGLCPSVTHPSPRSELSASGEPPPKHTHEDGRQHSNVNVHFEKYNFREMN